MVASGPSKRRRLRVVGPAAKPGTRRYLSVVPGETPRPSMAVWELTSACDQRCRACGARSGKRRPDELSTEEALVLVGELAALGIGEVVLIGGEAYLRRDLVSIVAAIREAGMSASMVTGALNLNAGRIGELADAGINLVSVSIDGVGDTHDRLRTPGSFAQAIRVLEQLREAGVPSAANTQINRLTYAQLPALVRILVRAGIRAWQPILTMPHGNAADDPRLVLDPYMLLDAFRSLEQALDVCDLARIAVWPGNNLGYFGPSEHRLRARQNSRAHYRGCTAGISGLGIESNGAIKACPSLGGEHNIGGRWREHGLRTIWERAPELRINRERTVEDLWGFCRTCEHAATCMGGCTATTQALFGRAGNNPFCHHRARVLDRRGLRERIEPMSDADPGPFGHRRFRVVLEAKPATRTARPPLAVVLGAALAACGGRTVGGDEEDGAATTTQAETSEGTSGESTSGESTSTSTTSATESAGSTDDADDGCNAGFVYGTPCWDSLLPECDPGLQDCPDGEKCTAVATIPDTCCVDMNVCAEVIGDKQLGEACDRTQDNDDCALGLFCMTETSGSTGEGVCLAFCDFNDPASCDKHGLPTAQCIQFNGGVLPLCYDTCDPLGQDCPDDLGCYAAGQAGFVCMNPGALADGESCTFLHECAPGLACVTEAVQADCPAAGCCTAFCDLDLGAQNNPSCAAPGDACQPWFEQGAEPPGYENVGYCGVE